MKIKSVLIFYNGYRGLIFKVFEIKGYDIFDVITKKYLDKDIFKIAQKKNKVYKKLKK